MSQISQIWSCAPHLPYLETVARWAQTHTHPSDIICVPSLFFVHCLQQFTLPHRIISLNELDTLQNNHIPPFKKDHELLQMCWPLTHAPVYSLKLQEAHDMLNLYKTLDRYQIADQEYHQRFHIPFKKPPPQRPAHMLTYERHQHLIIDQLITHQQYRYIIIGSWGTHPTTMRLMAHVLEAQAGTIFLPSFPPEIIPHLAKLTPPHAFYPLKLWVETLNINPEDIICLGETQSQYHCFTYLETQPQKTQFSHPHLALHQFDNETHEIDYLIKQLQSKPVSETWGIIIEDTYLKHHLVSQLVAHQILYQDLDSLYLKDTAIFQFLYDLLQVCIHKTQTSFINWLRNPYLHQNDPALLQEINQFEYVISQEHTRTLATICEASQTFTFIHDCCNTFILPLQHEDWHHHFSDILARIGKETFITYWQTLRSLPEDFESLLLSLQFYAAATPLPPHHEAAAHNISIGTSLSLRFHTFDHVFGIGLNHQYWPKPAHYSLLLPKTLCERLGITEALLAPSLQAYDFYLRLNQARITLSFSEMKEGKPQRPSPFWVKLAYLSPHIHKHETSFPHATPPDTLPPTPRPPKHLRPQSLSVTDIEYLMRDPYTIYAKHILRLKPRPSLDEPYEAKLYGTLIHTLLEQFFKAYPHALPEHPQDILYNMAKTLFTAHQLPLKLTTYWWPKWVRVIEWLIDFETKRATQKQYSLAEIPIRYTFTTPLQNSFTLTAKIDRIDVFRNGTLEIIDYKTGYIPSTREVYGGYAPQLPLAALMVKEGAPPELAPYNVVRLTYLKLKGLDEAVETISFDFNNPEWQARLKQDLFRLIDIFAQETTPYLAKPTPDLAPKFSAYDHLSREKLWGT